VEIRGLIEIAELELGNGFAVAISPEPGLTGESEGAVSRTGSAKVQQRIEAAGRELRSRNGGLETGSDELVAAYRGAQVHVKTRARLIANDNAIALAA
jgi:hypothetical protein